mmetsp:Transcript_23555/g.70601  ORF Transcript_23555/g.70601 Transcript_23555/m.70601 type:complete len:111 (+) Transcript_23555:99-431(+)
MNSANVCLACVDIKIFRLLGLALALPGTFHQTQPKPTTKTADTPLETLTVLRHPDVLPRQASHCSGGHTWSQRYVFPRRAPTRGATCPRASRTIWDATQKSAFLDERGKS